MNAHRIASKPYRGFTLLEFLVALTILALMLGMTMNSLNFSVRTSNSVESSILATEQVHLAHRALRRQIQQAVPLMRGMETGPDRLDFAGQTKALEFVAPLNGVGAYAGLHRVRFEIEDDAGFDGNGGRIVMYYVRDASVTDPQWTDAGGSALVMDGFASAEFDYSSETAPAGVDWVREWRDPARLPGLVRVRVEYPDGSERMAPDLVVAIRSTSRNRMSRRGGG